MDALIHKYKILKYFNYALYATYMTFQQSNRPSGNMQEGNVYFSRNHKLYLFKVEVSVLQNWFARFCSAHYPGSVSNISIMSLNKEMHKNDSEEIRG